MWQGREEEVQGQDPWEPHSHLTPEVSYLESVIPISRAADGFQGGAQERRRSR